MGNWAEGYVSEVDYVFGYCNELNPQRISLAFLNAGLAVPFIGTACELGFGQGVTANLHAAASVTEWCGTDFNPTQAGFAQELAATSGSGARFYDDAFAEFASRTDLPDFDFIGLHGIWSWISDKNRDVIVDFIRRKLKVGGVVYISYNTQPGWSSFTPMRQLLSQYLDVMSAPGQGIETRIREALEFATQFLATNPAYALKNPQVVDRIKKMKEQPLQYVAHEFFNSDWHPMHFDTFAKWLAPAKLHYACSARYLDNIESAKLTAEQQSFLKTISDPVLHQSLFDFMVDQQFRQDYWVKGPRKIDEITQKNALRSLSFILTTSYKKIPAGYTTAQGLINVHFVVELLADHRPKTLGQLEEALKPKGIDFSQLVEAVICLSAHNFLSTVQDDSVIEKVRNHSESINLYLMNMTKRGGQVKYLASPVTGGGVAVEAFHQLFLLALKNGKSKPVEWAESAWQVMASKGQGVNKNGRTLETAEENLFELTAYANDFESTSLPILRALQIA